MKFKKEIGIIGLAVVGVVSVFFFIPGKEYINHEVSAELLSDERNISNEALVLNSSEISFEEDVVKEPEFIVTHVETPSQVKAIYMSSWVGGTPSFRDKLVKIMDETEVNAVVIDIKDYTGKISFNLDAAPFNTMGSTENRIPDIKEFIGRLHDKNIYVIGRVSVFQDPHLVKEWPEEAVKTSSDKNVAWKDRKGISWMDAGSEKVWDYSVKLAKESYDVGFDEINFDYIRFPSDGNMKDIYYPHSEGKDKSEVIKSFFEYLHRELQGGDSDIKISADIFGMTTTNTDDLGIGQVLEDALANFDYVAPMVYPSHFPNNWAGLTNPAAEPYDVIFKSMGKAVERAKVMGVDPKKLRPWLQDFDLGADYTAEMVKAQIQATYDVELDSWMLWDPKNIYTKGALTLE